MPGKRQPTAVVEANGRKHLTAAEKDERLDREAMGLSVTSRCRIVVPPAIQNAARAPAGDETDEFTRKLRQRQAAALTEAE